MELELVRAYFDEGTNGDLMVKLCHTIELPWLHNTHNVSCIPEGRYELRMRYTDRRQHHLMIAGVPDRSGILLHPANHALTELRGCIAPVTTLIGPGEGTESRLANELLKAQVIEAFKRNEKVFITIKSKS